MRKNQIIATFKPYGHGWTWTFCENGNDYEYTTNLNGDGIFTVNLHTGEWKQLYGTCDVSFPRDEKSARRKVLNWVHGKF